MDRSNKNYKCIMANTNVIWQQATHTTTNNLSCSTNAIWRNLPLNQKNTDNWSILWENNPQDNGPLAEKCQDRKSNTSRQKNRRGEIGKEESNDSPEMPETGGKHQTSQASLQGVHLTTRTNLASVIEKQWPNRQQTQATQMDADFRNGTHVDSHLKHGTQNAEWQFGDWVVPLVAVLQVVLDYAQVLYKKKDFKKGNTLKGV